MRMFNTKISDNPICLIFNTCFFGDVLLCNTLCQNLRKEYPNAKIVYIVDKPFFDVAKYQKDVDEVIIYDKKGENKGFGGMLKFIKNFPYKNADMSFVIYRNERNIIISKLLGAKRILFRDKKCTATVQEEHANLLSKVTKKPIENFPIKYEIAKEIPASLKELVAEGENYIALCTVSKDVIKDCPIETAVDLINQINSKGINNKKYKVLFCGVGEKTKQYAEALKRANCEFVDLTNKTTIPELAKVLRNCKALVSVDTGTMHLGYALEVPTVCLFYKAGNSEFWAPNPEIYNVKILDNNITSNNIFDTLCGIL